MMALELERLNEKIFGVAIEVRPRILARHSPRPTQANHSFFALLVPSCIP